MDEPQLSHNGFPMDGALMGAGLHNPALVTARGKLIKCEKMIIKSRGLCLTLSEGSRSSGNPAKLEVFREGKRRL